jgi:hypothetical protein
VNAEVSGIFSDTFADDKSLGVCAERELPGARFRLQPGGGG